MTKLTLIVKLTADLLEADRLGLSEQAINEQLAALASWGEALRRHIEADPLASRCLQVDVRHEPSS